MRTYMQRTLFLHIYPMTAYFEKYCQCHPLSAVLILDSSSKAMKKDLWNLVPKHGFLGTASFEINTACSQANVFQYWEEHFNPSHHYRLRVQHIKTTLKLQGYGSKPESIIPYLFQLIPCPDLGKLRKNPLRLLSAVLAFSLLSFSECLLAEPQETLQHTQVSCFLFAKHDGTVVADFMKWAAAGFLSKSCRRHTHTHQNRGWLEGEKKSAVETKPSAGKVRFVLCVFEEAC